MKKKTYIIWCVTFVLLQLLLSGTLIGPCYSIVGILLSTIVCALLSNIIGLVAAFFICYEEMSDIYMYLFDSGQWLMRHSHGIGIVSVDAILKEDILSIIMAMVIVLHIVLSVMRCKELEINKWWSLVPLYNPIALLFRRSTGNNS